MDWFEKIVLSNQKPIEISGGGGGLDQRENAQ